MYVMYVTYVIESICPSSEPLSDLDGKHVAATVVRHETKPMVDSATLAAVEATGRRDLLADRPHHLVHEPERAPACGVCQTKIVWVEPAEPVCWQAVGTKLSLDRVHDEATQRTQLGDLSHQAGTPRTACRRASATHLRRSSQNMSDTNRHPPPASRSAPPAQTPSRWSAVAVQRRAT